MIADVRVVQWVAVAFAVLWLGVTLGSAWCILEVWRHYARWKRLETGSKALPLDLDVLPTTFSDVRRLYADPGLDEGEVESERLEARKYLRLLIRLLIASAIVFALAIAVASQV